MTQSFSSMPRGALAVAIAFGFAAAISGGASATTIYDATGGVEMGGDVIDPNATGGVGPVVADRFLNPVGSILSSVTLNLKLNGAPIDGFTVDLWRDSTSTAGLPVFGTEIQIASVSDSTLTPNFAMYTFMSAGPIKLAANTFYDIGIDTHTVVGDPQVTNVVFGNTVDPGVLARPSVALGAFYFHTVGGVDVNAAGPYELIVNVSVPEPSTWALLLLGLAGLGFVKWRRSRKTDAAFMA
jgi:hypothetical protein